MRWKYIKGTKKRYSISDTGLIRSNKYDSCIGRANRDGYMGTKCAGKSYDHHRLVALYFVKGDHTSTVNHIDGDKSNNHYTNLEWISQADNNRHREKLYARRKPSPKFTRGQVLEIRRLLMTKNCGQIAKMFNCTRYRVREIKRGLTYKNIVL